MCNKILYKALEKIITEVEKLPEGTLFDMGLYDSCVIGRTIGWPKGNVELTLLKDHFGIILGNDVVESGEPKFTRYSKKYYTNEQWKVIHLFTTACVENKHCSLITKEDWLEKANKCLNKNNKKFANIVYNGIKLMYNRLIKSNTGFEKE